MERLKVLLVTGVVTTEHDYRSTNEQIRKLLESTGIFSVRITEEFEGATARTLEKYDVVFLNYDGKTLPTDKEYKRFPPETEQVLADFVRSGKGLVVYHSAVWLEHNVPDVYRKIWGMYLTTASGGRRNPHGDFLMNLNPDTPFAEGVPEECAIVGDDLFAGVKTEPDTNVRVVATVFDDLKRYHVPHFPPPHHPVIIPEGRLENMPGVNTDQPVAWTNTYGNGRIFAISLGHDIDTLRRVGFLTLLCRGTEWAATGEVRLKAPDRTGENRLRKWPYY